MLIFAYMYRLLLVIAAAAILMNGCAKPATCNVICTDALTFAETGFDSTETSMIIIRSYAPDGTFGNIIDTKTFTTLNGTLSWQGSWASIKDTLQATHNYLEVYADTAYKSYDYEIVLPYANKTFYISQLQFGGASAEKQLCDGIVGCSRVASYKINNTVVTNSPFTYMLLTPQL